MKPYMTRGRRTRRAAAMVEALVAIPFFIIIFASMLYIVRLYGEKQRTLRVAKEYAWVYAMKNCEGDPGKAQQEAGASPLEDAKSNSGKSGAGDMNSNDTNTYSSAAGGDIFNKKSGSSSATVKGEVTASKIIGGYTNKISTTTKVQCNEAPREGSLLEVVKFAWKMTW